MALNIDGIKTAFSTGDFARTNLFEVEIPYLGKDFRFKCRGATLPAGQMDEVVVSYQNRKIKLAGDRTFEDWTITVYNDAAHETRQQFLDWAALATAQGKTIYGENPDAYKKNGLVRQFDRKGEETASYSTYGIFPKTVGEITLDWDTNNEVEVFEITFAMDYWTTGDGINA